MERPVRLEARESAEPQFPRRAPFAFALDRVLSFSTLLKSHALLIHKNTMLQSFDDQGSDKR